MFFFRFWSQVLSGGYPSPGWRGTPGQRYPPAVRTQDWGTPSPGQDRTEVPFPQTGLGYLLSQDRTGVPPSTRTRVPPSKTEQHSEHLLHGGRYASCFHAGGLSCFNMPLLPRCEQTLPLVGLWKWVSSLVLKVKLTEVALQPESFVSTSRLLLPPLTVCG